MSIEFACPNGHKLSSPDENAGRTAKCPRCGAATLVPKPGGSGKGVLNDAVGVSSGSGKGSGKGLGSGKEGGSGKGVAKSPSDVAKNAANGTGTPGSGVNRQGKEVAAGDGAPGNPAPKGAGAAVEEQIVFLCPNGHKLNAPQRLQGHAGQCPHCKATFRIPLVEQNMPASEKAQPTTESDEFTAFENGLLESAQDNGLAVEGYEMLSTVLSDAPAAGSAAGRTDAMPTNAHPLARLVARLWNEREHGGIVELHLTGGALLVPEWFDAKLSHDSHGLFAVQAADGSVTMTIVPWDSVQRVVVRGVIGLPDGLFE
jgi:hypothetical protein